MACVLVGINPITGFDDGTTESNVLDIHYEEERDAALSEKDWSFATRLYDITANRNATDPISHWSAAYQLPTDQEMLTVHGLYVNDIPVEYDRYGSELYCDIGENTEEVIVKIGVRKSEEEWPAYFRSYFVARLAYLLAVSVTRNPDIITAMERLVVRRELGGKFRDSTSRTAKRANLRRFANRRR